MAATPYHDRDGWIWMDGEYLPWRDAKVHILTHALHYASSVFEGERAYGGVQEGVDRVELPAVKPWTPPAGNATLEPADPVVLEHDWDQARRVMWDYVGIVRSDARLAIAAERLAVLAATVEGIYRRSRVTQDLLELRNIVLVGRLVVESAQSRKESRGLHFTETYPQRDDAHYLHDTLMTSELGKG